MKLLDKTMILLLNLCLLLSAILVPALCFIKSPAYYRSAFSRTGMYESIGADGMTYRRVVYYVNGDSERYALLSDAQLDAVADHIIAYLCGEREGFELYMDGVYTNEGYEDCVRLFGDTAIAHMADVRSLVATAEVFAVILSCLLPPLFLYAIVRRRSIGRLFLRYTLLFYAVLLSFAVLFILLTALLNKGELDLVQALWRNIHHLFFPFHPEKAGASFFNDALTYILRLDLFMGAVYRILGIVAIALSLLLAFAIGLRQCADPKIG